MDLPIQRLPPVVGPRPAPPIPRMGDRPQPRRGGDPGEFLEPDEGDAGDSEVDRSGARDDDAETDADGSPEGRGGLEEGDREEPHPEEPAPPPPKVDLMA